MHLNADISSALLQIEAVKKAVDACDDPKLQMSTTDDLQLIIDILQDPVFRSVVHVQESLVDLNGQISQHPSILPGDFDISVSGDLVLSVPPPIEIYDTDYPDEQRVPSAELSPHSPVSPQCASIAFNAIGGPSPVTAAVSMLETVPLENLSIHQTRTLNELVTARASPVEEKRPSSALGDVAKHSTDLMASQWTQIQAIELVNDGTGLGFGIIGARTSGVIVKTILPGGVADRDNRLQSGDHILQIGDVNLHDMVSEQVASVLRQSGTHVRLVVARPADPLATTEIDSRSTTVPSRLLLDPVELKLYLVACGYAEIFGAISTPSTPTATQRFQFGLNDSSSVAMGISQRPPLATPIDIDPPETERFNVELTKDNNGLGITIAGYVCEKEELSGIFVKSVSPGSAADLSGRIHVNDRIIEVDGQSLHGYSNHQAVEVLKRSGTAVQLCLERYLRGPKYDQLQQAIAANEQKPTTPNTLSNHLMRLGSATPFIMQSSEHLRSPFGIETSHDIADQEQSALLQRMTAENPSPVSSLSATSRKLIHARDSIENTFSSVRNAIDLSVSGDMVDLDDTLVETANVAIVGRHKYFVEPELKPEMEIEIANRWQSTLGPDITVIIAQIRKFTAPSGLGISLEGTVDVEGGREVRPHHYIRSILPEGPVGQNGLLRSGDELLEVNGQRLLGMNHLEVVSILKELPQDVRMVCGRSPVELVAHADETIRNTLGLGFGGSQNLENLLQASERLVKAKSDGSLPTSSSADDSFSKLKSRSLEPLTGLAMWSSEPQIIELAKGERGLGFSILDYQDPLDPNDTLIVIRSLVPGGVAQLDGRLIPGDRLLFVNEINLENASLDQAVQALKGAPKGIVRIGVAKPLPMADTTLTLTDKLAAMASSEAGARVKSGDAWPGK